MECKTVRELYVAALADAVSASEDVDRHMASCQACSEELRGLAATWAALGDLPLVEPRPELARRLRRRLRVEAGRETLVSLAHWQQAALVGVVGFLLSVLFSLLVPYDTMASSCADAVRKVLPTPGAYLVAGVLYGLVPLAIGSWLQARLAGRQTALGALESVVIFLGILAPYVLVRCAEFPVALLLGFLGGITLGAVAGAAAGTWLTRRPVTMVVS